MSRSTTRHCAAPPVGAARPGSRTDGPRCRGRSSGRAGRPASVRCRAGQGPGDGAATTAPRRCRLGRATARPHGASGDAGPQRGRPLPRPRARAVAPGQPGPSSRRRPSPRRSPAVAACSPACTAAPYPGRGSSTTVAPSPSATSAVLSRDPLSTTSARNPGGSSASSAGRAGASSRHGITTSHTALSEDTSST